MAQRQIGVRRLLLAGLVTPLLVSCAAHNSGDNQAGPAWTQHCFLKPGTESASDHAYVGLTSKQALAKAKSRGQQLVLVGAGGKCQRISDDVKYRAPVAIAFDSGTPMSGVPSNAKIVFATSDSTAEYDGWGLRG
jgi:hypothetical protein